MFISSDSFRFKQTAKYLIYEKICMLMERKKKGKTRKQWKNKRTKSIFTLREHFDKCVWDYYLPKKKKE